MSLKAIHILFVTCSTLLALGFAAWAFNNYASTKERLDLIVGVASVAAAIGLLAYGRYFLKKMKNVGYL